MLTGKGKYILTALFFAVSFWFWGVLAFGTLWFLETTQFFPYTGSHLAAALCYPGGISEYVGDAAFLVEDDENFVENLSKAIYYFINNPKVRQDYSKRGIERAKLYTRDAYFKRFCEIICTL